ncbi:MAG: glycoside hydrolase family 3 protein [Lachnospiraceae bacterium]|nr:glycoside hydrolase family 3 protein [Lachnospiraceae bacterium]
MSQKTREYAKELVSKMTIEEKMGQMLYESPAIERLGIPAYNWWNEALHGVARAGVATVFPQAIGMAAAFDPDFLYKVADVVSTEGRAKFNEFSRRGDRGIYKGLTFWAPNINIFRDPRWGRGHETFGEDPYLSAELGIAYIKGLQGDDSEHLKSAACAKHFAVHSGPEELRHEFDAQVSDHDLYDTYLYAFSRCVREAGVEAVMGAYNRVNGEPACGSKRLLKDILRGEWKFQGHIVSDCWAVNDFHENHHVTDTVEQSAALAVENGCDLNCGTAYLHLGEAYKQGLVTEEAITEAAERLIEVRIRLGMMEDYPSPYKDIPYSKVECKEHTELSVEAAKRSMVLLKNKDNILPLDKGSIKTIAVIGPNADSRDALVGNYTGTSSMYITPLEGIQQYLGDSAEVLYAEGCHLYKDKVEFLAEEKDRFAEAVIAAERADVVVMCLGLDATIEGEEGDAGNEYASGDKPGLKLPGLQQELLETVIATGKPVILVLLAGSAIDLSWADTHVNAIIDAWYPGARGGRAVAETIFGENSPSGKLPVTFYADTEELPDFCDYSMGGRTYRYTECNVLYPFGYGLSYSDICYTGQSASTTRCSVMDSVTVKTEITNNGQFQVNESVQVYIRHVNGEIYEPLYQLKGIKNILLMPGETKEAEITLSARDFAIITENGECVARPGSYIISIGGQQPDKRSEELAGKKTALFTIERTGREEKIEY